MMLADQTIIDPKTRELVQFAVNNSVPVHTFTITHTNCPSIRSEVWKISEDHIFHRGNYEFDNLTIPLFGMIREDSPLKWVRRVRQEFTDMREKLREKPGQSVLLSGPSGSGKLSLSQIAHSRGKRHLGPFVFASCKNPHLKHQTWDTAKSDEFRHNLKLLIREAAGGTLYFHETDMMDVEAQDILAEELLICQLGDELGVPVVTICATRKEVKELTKKHGSSNKLMEVLRDNVLTIPSLNDHDVDAVKFAKELMRSH